MKRLLTILLCLLVSGCGVLGPSVQGNFTANTTASVNPTNGFSYSSNKNQESLDATGEMNKDGTIKFHVATTASTPEASIAAAATAMSAAITALSNVLQAVAPIAGAAIQGAAAANGVPLPKPVPKPAPVPAPLAPVAP